MVTKDDEGQYIGPWRERDYALLGILEEVVSPYENPSKSLSAYLADILELEETYGTV